ncbi:MAG: VRR-NUC domain-containing protein [Spirochaetaceae bacterium]|nr:MAG: VRR-NUC domain-containing protein [Spirochaetaceae bacterium]
MSKPAAKEYPEELPVGYYLDNFQRILDFVASHYDDVLTTDEKSFSQLFRALSLDARRLYVRLISRKGPLFRSDTLSYAEIKDIEAAAIELTRNGFLEQDGPCELSEELALLKKAEILELIEDCGSETEIDLPRTALKALRKQQLVELALSLQIEIRGWIRGLFHLLRPQREKEILIYRLLFFGNLYQDLTEFVVTDLGHVRYESYEIRKQDRLFRSREILEDTFRLIELNEAFYQAIEGRSVHEIDANALLSLLEYLPQQSPAGEDPDLRRMRDNLINGIARHLERIGNDGQALHLYRMTELPPSRERQARILERQKRLEEAIELCRQIAGDPWEDLEREFAERYIRKLSGKLGLSLSKTEITEIPVQLLELEFDPLLGVEESVLRHYQGRRFTAYHGENVLWTGLFGLAFWDIVFLSLPGTFFNRYQRGPKDLYRPEFRRRRAGLIEERLRHIRSSSAWPEEMLELYDRKQGIASDLVHWKLLPRELVARCVRTIPRNHLAAIFDKLSEHLGANKSGFPDLVVFPTPRRRKTPAYELIEVKGPGDQLQINQRRWLRYFSSHGIPFRVVRVQWRE